MKTPEPGDTLDITTPSDREIALTRAFAAPRASVFEAFTKPELIRRWLLGPDGWSMPVCEVDLRPGGTFRYRWRSDAGGSEFGLTGRYLTIKVLEEIVHAERFDGADMPGETVVTTRFVERGDRTTVTLTVRYESREIRDASLASGMARGVAASFDRLAGSLDRPAAV